MFIQHKDKRMKAHEIIARTKGKGEAGRWANLTGHSEQLFNSYGYEPRNGENPLASGNLSPLYHYMKFFEERKACNPEGAAQMQRLLNESCDESLSECPRAAESLNDLSMSLLEKATRAVRGMNETKLEEASLEELRATESRLSELDSEVAISRAKVKAEIRRRTVRDADELARKTG